LIFLNQIDVALLAMRCYFHVAAAHEPGSVHVSDAKYTLRKLIFCAKAHSKFLRPGEVGV